MKSIGVEKIKEIENEGIEYLFVRINICQNESFAICILGEEFAFESLGEDRKEAEKMFDVLVENGVSAIHLEEILHDIKTKICF